MRVAKVRESIWVPTTKNYVDEFRVLNYNDVIVSGTAGTTQPVQVIVPWTNILYVVNDPIR